MDHRGQTCACDADERVLFPPKLAEGHGIHWRLELGHGDQVLLIVHPQIPCRAHTLTDIP